MMIAICDDDKKFLNELKFNIYTYSNANNWESVIDIYENGYDLINSKIKYDIIILDYQMNNINGLETAKQLRNGINISTCIIFLTSFPEIAIPAYSVDTYRFVVKSTLYDGLFDAFDDFKNIIKTDYDISVKTDNEYTTINTKDITFIEVQNKICYIHLANKIIIETKSSLTNLYQKVPHTHFFRIHKAFVINFNYILSRSSTFVKIKFYDTTIPISRIYLTKFKETYYNYLKDNKI